MLLFTGFSHFSSLKYDFAAMIPDPLPNDLWVIYATGVFEIAGALGLLIPRTRRLAGVCLVLLLVAMFPANVNAIINGIRSVATRPPLCGFERRCNCSTSGWCGGPRSGGLQEEEEVRLAQVKERVAEHEKPSFRQGAAS
jgi:hypothetical protein